MIHRNIVTQSENNQFLTLACVTVFHFHSLLLFTCQDESGEGSDRKRSKSPLHGDPQGTEENLMADDDDDVSRRLRLAYVGNKNGLGVSIEHKKEVPMIDHRI